MIARGLDLVGQLIGDAEPDVQKALSWALRELAKVDPGAGRRLLPRPGRDAAAATADGHRAWVLRDTLAKLPAADGDGDPGDAGRHPADAGRPLHLDRGRRGRRLPLRRARAARPREAPLP